MEFRRLGAANARRACDDSEAERQNRRAKKRRAQKKKVSKRVAYPANVGAAWGYSAGPQGAPGQGIPGSAAVHGQNPANAQAVIAAPPAGGPTSAGGWHTQQP